MTWFQLAQLAVSLVAILAVAALARWLNLGGDARIADDDHARRLADEAIPGFVAMDIARDRAGIGALLRGTGGQLLLVRRHGAFFAARLLDHNMHARLDRNFLTITTADRMFGTITLDLGGEAQRWAASLRHLGA